VLLLFAQCKMHYWWLVTWLDLTCELHKSKFPLISFNSFTQSVAVSNVPISFLERRNRPRGFMSSIIREILISYHLLGIRRLVTWHALQLCDRWVNQAVVRFDLQCFNLDFILSIFVLSGRFLWMWRISVASYATATEIRRFQFGASWPCDYRASVKPRGVVSKSAARSTAASSQCSRSSTVISDFQQRIGYQVYWQGRYRKRL
jgi:hypothetical protein